MIQIRVRVSCCSAAAAALALCCGCTVGPDYKVPAAPIPAGFKEEAGWKPASPGDAAPRGPWWTVFQDPVLDDLESRVAASNFSLQQAAANYEQARQAARADRTALLPTLSAVGSASREKSGTGSSGFNSVPASEQAFNSFSASLQASWEPDFWGRARRTTEAAVATAQADAADLASARLSMEAELAQDYIALRMLDQKRDLLDHAVDDYRHTLQITKNKYAVGVAARSDVLAAQTQLDSTRVQAIDAGIQRAQYEHAIAVLIGRAPSELTLVPVAMPGLAMPEIPPAVPSTLLERRPDVSASERAVAAANANVGVQTSGYFPNISLSATAGFAGSVLDRLFTVPNRIWSLGSGLSEPIFNAGQQRDLVLEARAAYDASVAGYREAVLGAIQQVEDDLVSLRLLGQEVQIQDAAVSEAAEATKIALNEYEAGTVDFTTVTTAQVTELNSRETALAILQSRLDSSVALVEALGGGWSTQDLPTSHQVVAGHSPPPAAIAAPR
jgi:NodT family efflux transporter outer membrane factor (OMF) lipoprotein